MFSKKGILKMYFENVCSFEGETKFENVSFGRVTLKMYFCSSNFENVFF